jgi:hypothetical protein
MPRAGDAFLNGTLPLTHDPLGRIDYHPSGPVVDLQAFIDAVTAFLNDTIFPILKDITGLDFSSPEEFLFSLVTMITNGGSAVAAFIDSLIAPIIAAIKQFTGIDLGTVFNGIDLTGPGAVLGGIQKAIGDLVGGLIQKIIDAIVGGLNLSGATGNDPIHILMAFLNPQNQLNNIRDTILTVSGELQALFAGLQGQVNTHTANIATLAGATTLGSGVDNLNRLSIGANWTNITGHLATQYWFNDGFIRTSGFAAGYYNPAHPQTDKHGAQIRLAAKSAGACRLVICSDTAMSNFAAVEVRAGQFGDDYIRLVTGSSPQVVVVQQQKNYDRYGLQSDARIDLRYDPAANAFLVFKDGIQILDPWVDSTNIVTHGATKRICPVVSNVDNNLFLYGPGITDFTFYDWAS